MRVPVLVWAIVAIGTASVVAAEETTETGATLALNQPDIFKHIDSYALIQALPLAIQSSKLFPTESLSLGELKTVPTAARHRKLERDAKEVVDSKDISARMLVASDPLYYGGEVGVLYGHATGKFGGDIFAGYAIGTVGNDKLQISVGTSYEDWNGRSPRVRVR